MDTKDDSDEAIRILSFGTSPCPDLRVLQEHSGTASQTMAGLEHTLSSW
jgi:hypothetical protein